MSVQILFIQGAGEVTRDQEQVIIDAIAHELGDQFKVTYPPMPDADHPSYLKWQEVLISNLDSLSGNVILLGHSLGGSIILKHFAKTPVPDKVLGMILFGVPYWKDQNWDISEYEIEDEFLENLSKLENIYLYHSHDDEVVPYSQFQATRQLIPNARWRVFTGLDHSYHGAIENMIMDIRYLSLNAK